MLSRRRFLAISGCAIGIGHGVSAETWRGHALGAEATITLRGPSDVVDPALAEARRILEEAESLFSLYLPDSTLSRLNATGEDTAPPARFADLLALCDRMVAATAGRFDPTVQPLWRALAGEGDIELARALVGWGRVSLAKGVRLAPGQALTLNGVAQGYATDMVVEALVRAGFKHALVHLGEFRGLGGPWRLAVEDPVHGPLGRRTLTDGAVATSSPGAMHLPGGAAHILDPLSGGTAAPLWSTVSVEADTAGLADALSTGLCLMPRDEIAALHVPGLRRVTLIDTEGNLTTL